MTTVRQLTETRIAETKQPLLDLGLELFREVAGAADLKSILTGRVSDPGCYVYRLNNQASRNDMDDGVEQFVGNDLGVVIVTRNVRDSRHGDSSDLNELYCNAVSKILLGWQPDDYTQPLEYGGGCLVKLHNNYHFWLEIYRTGQLWSAN